MFCLSIWGYCYRETDINYYNFENLSKKINSTPVNICFTCTLLFCMRYIFRHGQTLKTYDSVIKNTIDWLASYLRRLKISLKSWICKDKLNGFSLFSACLLKCQPRNSAGQADWNHFRFRRQSGSVIPQGQVVNNQRGISPPTTTWDETYNHTRSHSRTQRAKPLSWFKRISMVLFAHS